jgi:hypothetical protein
VKQQRTLPISGTLIPALRQDGFFFITLCPSSVPPRELLLRVHVILHRAVSVILNRVLVPSAAQIEGLKKSGTKRVSKSFPWN